MRDDNTTSQTRDWEDALQRHNAAVPKQPRHKHDFSRTVHSFGAWGHIGECAICGERAIFVIPDDQDNRPFFDH